MRRYEWSQLLEEADLLQLTQEALPEGPAARRRWSWKRMGAAAACAALLVCVMNAGAIAAGAEQFIRYLAGMGAAEENASFLVLAEPIRWTSGDWMFQVKAIQEGDYLTVDIDHFALEEYPETETILPGRAAALEAGEPVGVPFYSWQMTENPLLTEGRESFGDACYHLQLWAEGVPQERGDLQGDLWVNDQQIAGWLGPDHFHVNDVAKTYFARLLPGETLPGYAELGDVWCAGTVSATFRVEAQPEDGYTFRINDWKDDALWEFTLHMVPPAELSYTKDVRQFPQGAVTALVSQDGRSLSFYAERTLAVNDTEGNLWSVRAKEVAFVGASGTRYPAQPSYDRTSPAYMLIEYAAPPEMTEPVTAVEIGHVVLETMLFQKSVSDTGVPQWVRSFSRSYDYDGLDWTVQIPR